MLPQDYAWATALQKMRQRARKTQGQPLAQRKARLAARMTALREQLAEALRQKKESEAHLLYEQMVAGRAEQLALLLEQMENTVGTAPPAVLRHYVTNYQKDCISLAALIDRVFSPR